MNGRDAPTSRAIDYVEACIKARVVPDEGTAAAILIALAAWRANAEPIPVKVSQSAGAQK